MHVIGGVLADLAWHLCFASSALKARPIMLQFWELDNDHDFLISKDDLVRYGNHSLTYRIVERIFLQVRI